MIAFLGGRTRLCRSLTGKLYLLSPTICGRFVAVWHDDAYRIERYTGQPHAGAILALDHPPGIHALSRPADAALWLPLPLL